MEERIRRVVTGHDDNGKAIILSDGYATAVKTVPLWPGLVSTDIWKTSASPIAIGKSQPDPTLGRGALHPLMHRTETVDYAVVLEGEITMLLDDSEVPLKAGDVVIQRGTNHAWSNRSGTPVRMLYVLMDARFDPELKQVL